MLCRMDLVVFRIATHHSWDGLSVERIPLLPAALATVVGILSTTHQQQHAVDEALKWRLRFHADLAA